MTGARTWSDDNEAAAGDDSSSAAATGGLRRRLLVHVRRRQRPPRLLLLLPLPPPLCRRRRSHRGWGRAVPPLCGTSTRGGGGADGVAARDISSSRGARGSTWRTCGDSRAGFSALREPTSTHQHPPRRGHIEAATAARGVLQVRRVMTPHAHADTANTDGCVPAAL